MKIKTIILAICAIALSSNANAFDLNSLKNLNLGGLGNVVNSLISTDKVEISDLTGTWESCGPAINFKSENLLQKAGGTAMEATIENKLEKYYNAANLKNITLVFDGTENFTMTINGRTISGVVSKGSKDGTLDFNFSKLGNSKLSKVTAYVTKGTQLSLTFDITKLNTLISTAAKISGNATVSTISSLLNSYKGMYAGFKFNKK